MKIGLGTVQFGLKYGISNSRGKTDVSEVKLILEYAEKRGIRFLDTASTYGDSEECLGEALRLTGPFSIVTKTPPVQNEIIGQEALKSIDEAFAASLKRLGVEKVYCLMVHHAKDFLLDGSDSLFERLQGYVTEGLIGKIGVSVYDPESLRLILERYPIDLVQLPINVFDQRFLEDNYLSELKKSGIEIHARSIFLQGLLLMQALPGYFAPIKGHFDDYMRRLEARDISPLEAAAGFVNAIDEIDVMLCGVNDLSQLREIVTAADTHIDKKDFACFAVRDETMINPVFWKL